MTTKSARPFSPWPYAIIGSFILLAAFDAVIVTLAYRTKTDVIEANPFEAGLKYESIVDAKRQATADGIQSTVKLARGEALVTITGLRGNGPWTVALSLLRPNDARSDQTVSVSGPGPTFKFPLEPLATGLWIARLSIKNASANYFMESREIAP